MRKYACLYWISAVIFLVCAGVQVWLYFSQPCPRTGSMSFVLIALWLSLAAWQIISFFRMCKK